MNPLRRRWVHLLVGLLSLVAVTAIWPARFGGSSSFVVVRGRSMEPTFALGDLVYIRAADYRVGDIVVYQVPAGQPGEGTNIVHRIRAVRADGTYVFRGDNNTDADVFRPTRRDLVGRAVADLGGVPVRAIAAAR